MTHGQELALGILLAIVLFRWVLPDSKTGISKLGAIWTAAWTSASDPFSTSTNPFIPVIVGTGGDLAVSAFPNLSAPQVTLGGTLNGKTFTPTDTRIPSFICDPSVATACVIPTTITQAMAKLGLTNGWDGTPAPTTAGAA